MTRVKGFFGHHKCGSTWVQHIVRELARACGLGTFYSNGPHDFAAARVLDVLGDSGAALLLHVNANFNFLSSQGEVGLSGVHVVRDPRDLLVSAYYSHRNSHPAQDWPALQEFREVLLRVPRDVGLLLEMDFCSDVFEDLRSWTAAPKDGSILQLRFEELVAEPLAGFGRIAESLGLADVPDGVLEAVIDQYSFRNLAGGRDVGQEDANHHYRKGTPGDWRDHFDAGHKWAFARRFQDVLDLYGYQW